MRELRPYQLEGIEAIKQSLRQGIKRICVMLPTGGGKTLISATIAQGALSKGNRLAFVVPRISLIDQTVEEYYKEDIRDVGVIQSQHPLTDWGKPIQICSIDTIRSKKAFPDASIVIFDECHLWTEAHAQWMKEKPDTIFIGLSATPWRKGLGKFFESLLVMSTTQELIDQGYLSPFRVFASSHPDLSDVKVVGGEYKQDDVSAAMQKGTLTADIVKTYKDKWGKGKTLCFAVDCAHARAIQERFEEAGVKCGYQDAHTPDEERRDIKRKFHDSSYEVVVSVGTLILGVDWAVECISYCRPTRSEMLFVQAIGRGLRPAPGKEFCTIFDHTDTTSRLGFVTSIQHDELDDGKQKPKTERQVPLPKECKSCSALLAPGIKKCPVCGFERKPATSGIVEDDGELQEIVPGLLPKRKKGEKREYTMAEKSQFFAELKGYAAEKNYKDGWCANKYREKFSVFPNHPSIKYVVPATPSVVMRSWIRSRQIAWIKSKKYAEQQAANAPTGD